ncbi:hypothetical protein BC833DRAFT_606789 [Globomyces pollinis-pini]|nr:hypothetical protein BC833DRAFT_606789 [Globomyces pollinis-pini]
MALATPIIITLTGGGFFTGMNLALIYTLLRQYKVNWDLEKDEDRQTVLCVVLLISTIAATIVYPLNEHGSQVPLINFLCFTFFIGIQFGLVIINHNTLFRFSAAFPNIAFFKFMLNHYAVLYIIPLFTMIPIYLAAYDSRNTHVAFNKNYYNTEVFKPLNIALVFITELLAVITDMCLLSVVVDATSKNHRHSMNSFSNKKNRSLKGRWKEVKLNLSGELWSDYIVIWFLLAIDISLKLAIASGVKIVFDSSVSIATMVMRARFNLQYKSSLEYMLIKSKRKYTQKISSITSDEPPTIPNNVPANTFDFSNVLDSFIVDEGQKFAMKSFNPLDKSHQSNSNPDSFSFISDKSTI